VLLAGMWVGYISKNRHNDHGSRAATQCTYGKDDNCGQPHPDKSVFYEAHRSKLSHRQIKPATRDETGPYRMAERSPGSMYGQSRNTSGVTIQ
jgi:hypothetical protein